MGSKDEKIELRVDMENRTPKNDSLMPCYVTVLNLGLGLVLGLGLGSGLSFGSGLG